MRGIVLAGGQGSRLYPLTNVITKQLLPVYDKPMIYYPVSVLMLAGIRDVLIISTPRDLPMIEALLGDGSEIGMNLSYKVQDSPDGIAQAFLLGEEFLAGDPCCLVLGDNIFYADGLSQILQEEARRTEGASVFAYHVVDPERYGVVEFDSKGKAISIEEKPKAPKSSWAVTGLYFYSSEVVEIAKSLKPSARGELEITDLNKVYLERGQLEVQKLSRGAAWLDAGTPDSLLSASHFIKTLESRQGLKVACIEEIALVQKFIGQQQFTKIIEKCAKSDYGKYLQGVLNTL